MAVVRRFVVILSVVVASLGIAAPSAHAHTQECAGQGTMRTPLVHYVGVPVTGGLSMTFSTALCLPGPTTTLSMAGTMAGNCGLATGSGTFNGHPFEFTWVGTQMTLRGDATGDLDVQPDPTTSPPQSCVAGATRFIVTGTVTMI